MMLACQSGMKFSRRMSFLFVITVFCSSALAGGDESALKQGDPVGAFYVTKVAGADDGVQEGQELCYRCRYGSRPMVIVFARQSGGNLPRLVEELDKAVETNKDDQLRGLVAMMGKDKTEVTKDANRVVERSGVKHLPVVIAKETETGPANYKLDKNAEVTIVCASDSQVVTTHIFSADKIDIAMVMRDIKRMLN